MRRIFYSIIGMIPIFLSGCSTLSYFELPVYQVDNTPFPAVGGKLVLVNNAIIQPADVGSFVVTADQKEQRLLFENDSANTQFLNVLGSLMLETDFLPDVFLYDIPMRSDSSYRQVPRLTASQQANICRESGADWILSLDALPYSLFVREKVWDKDFRVTEAEMEIQFKPIFRLYRKEDNEPVKHYFISDTVRWSSASVDFNSALQALPALNNAFRDGMYFTAEKALHQWVPYKETLNRYWVKYSHAITREAHQFLVLGDYESAAYMWEYGYESGKKQTLRFYSAYNRALLAELQGDLNLAIQWIDLAIAIHPEGTNENLLDLQGIKSSLLKQKEVQKLLKEYSLEINHIDN